MSRRFSLLICVLLTAVTLATIAAGVLSPEEEVIPEKPDLRLLYAEGTSIYNAAGEKVFWKAINAGGLFLQEEWMCPTQGADRRSVTETLVSRFGRQKTDELFEVYENTWWQEDDFDRVKAAGFNLIRLPIGYFNLEDAEGKLTRWEKLDWFVDECDERDIYVLFDLHGAYGSQNGKDHSGDTRGATLFTEEENMDKTVALWVTLAERYKERNIVAGYDLLNEPQGVEGITKVTPHWAFYDRLYKAIRAVDPRHIIVIESVWETDNLPNPELFGWENVVYSYHNYCWENGNDYEAEKAFVDEKIADYNEAVTTHGVPVFVGEFTCFDDPRSWDYTIAAYTENTAGFAVWTYKVYAGTSSWGLYYGMPTERVNPETDDFETIKAKWGAYSTANMTENPLLAGRFKDKE